MVTQVEFNRKTANPYYGMSNTLQLFQGGSKGMFQTSLLESAWNEAKTDEQKAMVLTVLFFIGDVNGRTPYLFGSTKVDNGGSSQREAFRDTVIPFLVAKTAKMSGDKKLRLMTLITEYTTMDNIFATRVKTQKNSQKVQRVINMIDVFGLELVATYAAKVISNGTEFQKTCLAKYLSRPRLSKRAGHKTMLPQTKAVMDTRAKLIALISDKVGFAYSGSNFAGYYAWRKNYNQGLESVLFSSGNVKSLSKDEFIQFLQTTPAEARFRIKKRLYASEEKWATQLAWYKEWESLKESAQAEQRVLENNIAQGIATEEDKVKLAQVKKTAKVTTGAVNFQELAAQILTKTVDPIKVQPILDKVNLPYNTLVFIDDSGSMNAGWGSSYPYNARTLAAFIATICLSKNPDVEARDLVGLFSNKCRLFNGISSISESPNSLLNAKRVSTGKKPLLDPTAHFLTNFQNFKKFLDAESVPQGTNIGSIPENINSWVNGNANRLEEIQRYPVWTLISDGNFNNLGGASSSLNDFMRKCENYFGFKPYLILIDVAGHSSQNITTFSGIDNVMMIPPTISNIEMFLTNFKDMDVYDVYTPLLSLSRSNRYAPLRDFYSVKSENLAVASVNV